MGSASLEEVLLKDEVAGGSDDEQASALERRFEDESLYHIIEAEYGYTINRAVRTLEARTAGEREAKLLGMKRHAPIQYIETITYLRDNIPIEFSQAHYRGDRNTFTFELKKIAS